MESQARDKQSNEIMGRKKDGNERHKTFGVCRSYKVIMKWKNGKIVKKKKSLRMMKAMRFLKLIMFMEFCF